LKQPTIHTNFIYFKNIHLGILKESLTSMPIISEYPLGFRLDTKKYDYADLGGITLYSYRKA